MSGGAFTKTQARQRSGTQANTASERFVEWTTFHQSFAYEDFVEALRPVLSEEDRGGISHRVVPGVFRRIWSW